MAQNSFRLIFSVILHFSLSKLLHDQSPFETLIFVPENLSSYRRHDGHGIIADATTRLLFSYSEPYRSQIIDYFFKPNFGASLKILKVEIGGDGQNTLGTSSSHWHAKSEQPNFKRGMLWWLMDEVKLRNPSVQFYGLAWCFPGWLKNRYSDDTAEYLATWLDGAKARGLPISYIGLSMNEMTPCANSSCSEFPLKRAVFDAHGHKNVKIVAPDAFMKNLRGDAEMLWDSPLHAPAVDIFGIHG